MDDRLFTVGGDVLVVELGLGLYIQFAIALDTAAKNLTNHAGTLRVNASGAAGGEDSG